MGTVVPSEDVVAANSEGEDILRKIVMTDGSDKEILRLDVNNMGPDLDCEEDTTRPDNGDGDANITNGKFVWEQGRD